MKKAILFFILFIGFAGCCGDVKSKWNIIDFVIDVSNSQNQTLGISGEITGDSLYLTLIFNPEFVESTPFLIDGIGMNSAMAFQCPNDGDQGMEDHITAINIYSDSLFNDFPPKASLNSIISSFNGLSLDEWVTKSPTWGFEFYQWADFVITEKPTNNPNHQFTVELTLNSGEQRTAQTIPFIWN